MSSEFDALSIPTSKSSCLCYIPTLAFTLLIGLTYNLKRPHFDLQEFYLPGLDLNQQTNNNNTITPITNTTSLFFDLSLENVMDDHSVRYGDINLTFSFGHNTVANYTVPTFYQGKGKTAHRRELLEVHGVPLDAIRTLVGNGSRVIFRVDLLARVRYRFWFWYSKRKGVKLGSEVQVDGSGFKVHQNDIRLRSAAAPYHQGRIGGVVLIVSLLVITLLIF